MNVEELIFHQYKDTVIEFKQFKQLLMKKYKLSNDEARNIVVKINNYQIKKYGKRLDNMVEYNTKEELKDINHIARIRQKDRINKTWENKKHNKKYNYL